MMKNTSPNNSEKQLQAEREVRFAQYLEAAGLEKGEEIFRAAAMREWLVKNAFPNDLRLAVFLACPVYRMLKRLDSISVLHDPLGLDKPPSYDAARGEKWIRHCVNSKIGGIRANWGGDETAKRLNQVTKNIREEIERLTAVAFRTDQPEEKYETFAGGFEQIPTFGLFPFYLHKERIRNWHVLPFGVLKELGMVLDAESAAAVLPENVLRCSSGPENEITISINDIKEIISTVDGDNDYRFLYLGGGHAAYRIILNSLGAEEYGLLRRNLDDVHSVRRNSKTTWAHVGDIVRGRHSRWKYILLSDLGDPLYSTLRRKNKPKNSLLWIRISLEEDIPVGIGFSLFTMAKFLKMPLLFREISRIILDDIVKDEVLLSSLREEGVMLNQDYIEYLKLLSTEEKTEISLVLESRKEEQIKAVKEEMIRLLHNKRNQIVAGADDADVIIEEFNKWESDVQSYQDLDLLNQMLKAVIDACNLRPEPARVELAKIFSKHASKSA